MKAETQAVLLEKMMQNKKVHPEFELTLPLFNVKKSTLKRLSTGDVFLLALDTLELRVIHNDSTHKVSRYAKLIYVENNGKEEFEIASIHDMDFIPLEKSKYEEVKCVFSKIEVHQFEVGSRLTLKDNLFDTVEVFNVNSDITAEGKLIEVDSEIAIEITKVYDV